MNRAEPSFGSPSLLAQSESTLALLSFPMFRLARKVNRLFLGFWASVPFGQLSLGAYGNRGALRSYGRGHLRQAGLNATLIIKHPEEPTSFSGALYASFSG